MAHGEFVRISDAKNHIGKTVTVRVWTYQNRSSGKKLHFLLMRDGSGIMQGILFLGETPDESIANFEKLTQESSVYVTGVLKAEPRSPGGVEMSVRGVEIVQVAEPYPISPKDHGIEF